MNKAYKEANKQLDEAWNNFNFVTDANLIDFCIYQIKKCEILSDNIRKAEKEKRAALTAPVSRKSFVDKLQSYFTKLKLKNQI